MKAFIFSLFIPISLFASEAVTRPSLYRALRKGIEKLAEIENVKQVCLPARESRNYRLRRYFRYFNSKEPPKPRQLLWSDPHDWNLEILSGDCEKNRPQILGKEAIQGKGNLFLILNGRNIGFEFKEQWNGEVKLKELDLSPFFRRSGCSRIRIPDLKIKYLQESNDSQGKTAFLEFKDKTYFVKEGFTLKPYFKLISIGSEKLTILHIAAGKRQEVILESKQVEIAESQDDSDEFGGL